MRLIMPRIWVFFPLYQVCLRYAERSEDTSLKAHNGRSDQFPPRAPFAKRRELQKSDKKKNYISAQTEIEAKTKKKKESNK